MHNIISLDQQISAHFVNWTASSLFFTKLFSFLGIGLVYIVAALLVYVWFAISRKDALRAAATGLLAWMGLSKIIAKLVHRARPDMAQIGVKELVFHRPDTSFPSDHSSFLMAIAISFYLAGHKKLGHFVLACAILTGIARVAIGVHFTGDILGGWLVGAVMAYIIHLINQPLDQYLLEPIVKFARKLHL